MIDIPDHAIFIERRASDGRFLLFTNTDLPENSLLPWASVMADIYGDGSAFFVRLDETTGPEGFTLLDLLDVVALRAAEEVVRQPTALSDRAEAEINRARDEELIRRARLCRHDDFGTGVVEPTPEFPYRLAAAWAGANVVSLCRSPSGQAEGITLEQLLIVAEQLCLDASERLPNVRQLRRVRNLLADAIRCEKNRVQTLRGANASKEAR